MVKVVIIKGSPKFGKVELSEKYYAEVTSFLKDLGVEVVVRHMSKMTSWEADVKLYVAHSRACQLAAEFNANGTDIPFVEFGSLDGITHPVDRAWLEGTRQGLPPDEHFEFISEQKELLGRLVHELLSPEPTISGIQTLRNFENRRQGRRQNISGFNVRRS